MSRWTEQNDNHPIYSTFNEIFDYLRNPNAEPFNGDESEIRRLEKILTVLYNNVKNADLELFSLTALQELDSTLKSQYLSKLKSYASTPDISAYITTINNQNTLTASPFYQVQIELPIERKDYLETVYDELANRINTLNQKLEHANKTIDNLASENNRLTTELQEVHNKQSIALSNWQTEFSNAEHARTREFNSGQDQRNTEFSSKQQDYAEDIREFLNEKEQIFADWHDKNNEELTIYTKNLKEKNETILQSIIDDSGEKHGTICKLYGIVADKSVTGGYAKVAREEKGQFVLWKVFSFAFLIFALGWLIYSYDISDSFINDTQKIIQIIKDVKNPDMNISQLDTVQGITDWQAILSKFSVTFMLLFGVYFCSHQATKHRDELRRAIRLELQMTALDPYIHQLAPEEQLAIKKELVSKFFIGVENFETKEKMQTPINLIIDGVVEKLKELPELTKK